jgi:hypothetical protein
MHREAATHNLEAKLFVFDGGMMHGENFHQK